MPNKKRNN